MTVLPDDTFIVSYPRSGNTWFRFLVANLFSKEPASFANIESRVPDIYQNSDLRLQRLPHPRVLKSHEAFTPRYPRVVYLVRDPRDVAVSTYHYSIKQRAFEDGYPIERFVDHFLDPTARMNPFGTWGEHVASWLSCERGSDRFVPVLYEDLFKDTAGELRRIAPLIGAGNASDADLERAVALSDASEMRKSEKLHHQQWASTRKSREDKPFVRAASPNTFVNELPAAAAAKIVDRWGDLMRRLRYL